MSSKAQSTGVIVEWSPGSVSAFDSARRTIYRGTSLADIAPSLSSRDVVMAIGRRACFVRSLTVPDAPKQDLLQGLRMSIGQHVPIGTADACVDLRIVGDVGPDGRAATLVAMRAVDLRTLYDEARQAGLRIIATVPAAYGSWVLANGTSLPNCAAVSESADGLGVDLIQGGELRYSRALPPNSSNGQLAPEILRTFSAAGLKSSPTLAQGFPVPSAEYSVAKTPLEALAGTGWSTPGVRFELPEAVAARAKAGKSRRARLATFLCAAALLLATFAYVDRANAQDKVNKEKARIASSLKKLSGTRDRLLTQTNEQAAMQATLARGFKPAQRLGDIAALVNNLLPPKAWLTSVGVERGQAVNIRGTALGADAVPTYLNALNHESRLRDVKLVFANNALIESTPVVQFSISAFPVGNLPLVDKIRGARK
ncbi:MAG: hypothetical protein QOJ65_1522 [Fimbriimonadaceae bacterium]|jgi:Tfp pilus assembly protein PilN|nr:hypothetical protein [Fimbriimonadaceae bacterium]